MPVSCLLSHTYHDLRCPVCGEGFLILAAEMETNVSRTTMKREASEVLRSHHTSAGALHVHPTEAFEVFSDDHAIHRWHAMDAPFAMEAESLAA